MRVARLQRIMCHPDRLLREKGLSKEEVERVNVRAKAVGEAADILSDPKERAKYDAANQREKGRW